jgi:hypothetical protein
LFYLIVRDDLPAIGLLLANSDGSENFDLTGNLSEIDIFRQSLEQRCDLFFGAHASRLARKRPAASRAIFPSCTWERSSPLGFAKTGSCAAGVDVRS